MPLRPLLLSSFLTAGLLSPLGAYTVGSGYQASVLASTVTAYDFTQFEGISKSGDTLYVGNFTTVKQINTKTGVVSDYGSLPGNNGISHVTYANGKVYASAFTSYSAPYPYKMYSLGQGGSASGVLDMDGIFDAKTAPNGDFYFVANPDLNGDGEGDGSRLYRLNYADSSVAEVAVLGGASGGLAFDAAGNLFYSHYDNGAVYSFSAAQLQAGNLVLADANTALLLENPGYLGLDGRGNLIVSRLDYANDLQIISVYDRVSGELIEDIFTVDLMAQEQIGGFLSDGEAIYIASQSWDWSGDGYGSELIMLTPTVPEPAAFALVFALAAGAEALRRRRRCAPACRN